MSEQGYVVELAHGMWLSLAFGDIDYTKSVDEAEYFKDERDAQSALSAIRTGSGETLPDAKIYLLNNEGVILEEICSKYQCGKPTAFNYHGVLFCEEHKPDEYNGSPPE